MIFHNFNDIFWNLQDLPALLGRSLDYKMEQYKSRLTGDKKEIRPLGYIEETSGEARRLKKILIYSLKNVFLN